MTAKQVAKVDNPQPRFLECKESCSEVLVQGAIQEEVCLVLYDRLEVRKLDESFEIAQHVGIARWTESLAFKGQRPKSVVGKSASLDVERMGGGSDLRNVANILSVKGEKGLVAKGCLDLVVESELPI